MSHQTINTATNIMQVLHSTTNKQNYYLIYNSLRFQWQQMEYKKKFFGKFISWEILEDLL